MTIKKRIIISSVILFTLFLLMVCINWLGSRSVMNKTTIAYMLEKARMHVQGIFRGVNEFIIDEGEPLSVELTQGHVEGFDQDYALLKNEVQDEGLRKKVEELIEPQWLIVKDGTLKFMKDNPWISVDDDDAMLQYGKLTTEAKKLLKEVEVLAAETKEIAESTSRKIQNIVNIVAGIILTVIAFFLFSLYYSITRPIVELNMLAEGLSKGNLGIDMNDSRKDEFGVVASLLNKATSKLSTMISNVKDVTNTLSISSDNVSTSSSQIARNTVEQSGQTSQAASAIEQMNASFLDVAKNSATAAESSQEAAEFAAKGGEVVSETIRGMSKIFDAVKESAITVGALGKRSEQIGEIIQVINDIAGQTNLLALNAAIEAARAGEQGRGFAVVADEVKKLAERTSSATHDIGDMIQGIQDDTAKAVESMQGGTKEVEAGMELANQAGEGLQQIVTSIQNVTDMVRQIAIAAEEQSTRGDVIASNVESVTNLTQQNASSAEETASSAHMLNEMAKELRQMVSEFRLREEGSDGGTPEPEESMSNFEYESAGAEKTDA